MQAVAVAAAAATIAADIPSSIPLMNPITQAELEPFLDKPSAHLNDF